MDFAQRKEALISLLGDANPLAQAAANQSLARIEASENLAQILIKVNSDDKAEAVEAVYALRNVITPDGLQALGKIAKHEDVNIRAAAFRVIHEMGDKRFVRHAIEAVRDESESVAISAVQYLATLEDQRIANVLQKVLRDVPDVIKAEIIIALAALNSPTVIPLALKAAKSPNADIRRAAAIALGAAVTNTAQ